jgi:hypothetical protein
MRLLPSNEIRYYATKSYWPSFYSDGVEVMRITGSTVMMTGSVTMGATVTSSYGNTEMYSFYGDAANYRKIQIGYSDYWGVRGIFDVGNGTGNTGQIFYIGSNNGSVRIVGEGITHMILDSTQVRNLRPVYNDGDTWVGYFGGAISNLVNGVKTRFIVTGPGTGSNKLLSLSSNAPSTQTGSNEMFYVQENGTSSFNGNIVNTNNYYVGGSNFLGMGYTSGQGVRIGAIQATGGGGWDVRFVDNNNAVEYAIWSNAGSRLKSSLQITGSVRITGSNALLTLDPYVGALPTTGVPSGSFANSGSEANLKPYFWNGATWTALF